MIHSRLGSCLGAALLAVLLSVLLEGPAQPAPLPKDKPTLRVTPAGEMKLTDLQVEDVALIDENTLVLVGAKEAPEGTYWDKLDPNGAIIDLAKKRSRAFTNGHTAMINSVSVARGRLATASISRDPVLRVWDLKTDKTVTTVEIEKTGEKLVHYWAACFHKSDRMAVAADERVIVFDLKKPNDRTEFPCPAGSARWVDKVRVSPDDAWLAASGDYDQLVFWEVASRKATALTLRPKGAKPPGGMGVLSWMVHDFTFAPTGTLFAARGNSAAEVPEGKAEKDMPAERRGVVRIDVPSGDLLPLGLGHASSTLSCAVDPTGIWLATGGCGRTDGELRVYHLPTGELVYRTEPKDSLPLKWVSFTPSGKRIVSATGDGIVRWWDIAAR